MLALQPRFSRSCRMAEIKSLMMGSSRALSMAVAPRAMTLISSVSSEAQMDLTPSFSTVSFLNAFSQGAPLLAE